MKKSRLLLLTIPFTLAIAALGQGTVNFANASSVLGSPPDRSVRFVVPWLLGGSFPVSSNAFGINFSGLRAQLFYGATADMASLVAVSSAPATFRNSTSVNAGAWFGGARTLDGFGSGALVYLQVRVWDLTLAPDWNAAIHPGYSGLLGWSPVFTYTVTTNPLPAPGEFNMHNLQGFALYPAIPEPTTPSLLSLAAMCLILARSQPAIR